MASAEAPPASMTPTPPPEGAEAAEVDLSVVHLDPYEDVLSQIRSHARTFLGHDTIKGLSYTLGDTHYVVDSDVLHHLNQPHKKMRKVLPSFSKQTGGAHTLEYVPEEVERITVEGYDFSKKEGRYGKHVEETDQDGHVKLAKRVSQKVFEGARFKQGRRGERSTITSTENSEFGQLLNGIVRKALEKGEPLPTFYFNDTDPIESYGTETKVIPVDLSGPASSVLEAVLNTAEIEHLDDTGLTGLSWTRDGHPYRIADEKTLSWQADYGPGRHTLREFYIEVLSPDGEHVINRYPKSLEELGESLEAMHASPSAPLTDLRFEVSKNLYKKDMYTEMTAELLGEEMFEWFGWIAAGRLTEFYAAPAVKQRLSLDEAADLLSYEDILGEDPAARAEKIKEMKNDLNHRRRIKALQAMAEEIGANQLINLADSMLKQYQTAMRKLGLRQREHDKSLGWIFEELADSQLDADKIKRDREDRGQPALDDTELPYPTGEHAYARLIRRDIVNVHIGEAYAKIALHKTEKPTKKPVPIKDRKPGDDHFKEVNILETDIEVDRRMITFLQPIARNGIDAILLKAETGKDREPEALTRADYARIGLLLRRHRGHGNLTSHIVEE